MWATPSRPNKQNKTSIPKALPYLRSLKQPSPDKQNLNYPLCLYFESHEVVFRTFSHSILASPGRKSPTNVGIALWGLRFGDLSSKCSGVLWFYCIGN